MNKETNMELIVLENKLVQGNQMVFSKNLDDVLLPFIAISKALGANVDWKGNNSALIELNNKRYNLNIDEISLYEEGSQINLIFPTPGEPLCCDPKENELLINYVSLKTVLEVLRIPASIQVDYNNKSVRVYS